MKRLILVIMISRIFTYNLPPQSEIESMTKSEKIILYKNYDKSIGIAMSLNLIPLPFFHFGFALSKTLQQTLVLSLFLHSMTKIIRMRKQQ